VLPRRVDAESFAYLEPNLLARPALAVPNRSILVNVNPARLEYTVQFDPLERANPAECVRLSCPSDQLAAHIDHRARLDESAGSSVDVQEERVYRGAERSEEPTCIAKNLSARPDSILRVRTGWPELTPQFNPSPDVDWNMLPSQCEAVWVVDVESSFVGREQHPEAVQHDRVERGQGRVDVAPLDRSPALVERLELINVDRAGRVNLSSGDERWSANPLHSYPWRCPTKCSTYPDVKLVPRPGQLHAELRHPSRTRISHSSPDTKLTNSDLRPLHRQLQAAYQGRSKGTFRRRQAASEQTRPAARARARSGAKGPWAAAPGAARGGARW
jgi:hypothetical protein